MSAYLRKSIVVWVLGFLTFLAFLNAFNAALQWTLNGSDHEFEPYIIGQFTGRMPVTQYFWISVATILVFLGCTSVMAFRKPPLDPDLVEMINNMNSQLKSYKIALEEGLETNKEFIKAIKTDMVEKIEAQKRANERLFDSIGAGLESMGEELLGALAKQEKVLTGVGRESRKNVRTIEKTATDLDEMKTRLETLENALALPQPQMTSHSNPQDVKGIGPRLAEELKAMGITSVGEFLNADPVAVEDKTRLTRETAESLQGTVQLLMIPGIDDTDVDLLEEAGVTNRKELAKRDPFELSRKLAEVAKTQAEEGKISEAEKPTVEEVLSWVKLAKL